MRAESIGDKLTELFPNPAGTALDYSNQWELLVAVILSAQCTDRRVNEVTEKLFAKYSTLEDYVNADSEEFEQDIYSTGFYKNKTKHILKAARILYKKYDGDVPNTMKELTRLPGVGRKTANVVLGNAFAKTKGFVVDTHVRRFARKFDLTDSKDPKKIERDLMGLFPKEEWFPMSNRFILYGREYCPARKHECINHPLTKLYPPAAKKWPKAS